jgi:hypothetical protein
VTTFWITVFAVWFLLTILNQFTASWTQRLRRFDVLSLAPVWIFFAPAPVVSDFRLFYRTIARDGAVSAWEEIHPPGRRTSVTAFWHPEKRATKAVSDIVRFLKSRCAAGPPDPEILHAYVPYRCLLNHVTQTAKRSRPDHLFCEFFVAETTGFSEVIPEQPLLRSPIIRLTSES